MSEDQFKDLAKASANFFTSLFDLTSEAADVVTNAIRRKKERADDEALKARLSTGLDTGQLEAALTRTINAAHFPDLDQFAEAFYNRLQDTFKKAGQNLPVFEIRATFVSIAVRYYDMERFNKIPNPMADVLKGEIEAARYRDRLLEIQRKIADPLLAVTTFSDCLIKAFLDLSRALPPLALDAVADGPDAPDETPTIPLIDLLHDTQIIKVLYTPLFTPAAIELGLFKTTRNVIVSTIAADGPIEKHKGDMAETVDHYLEHTLLNEIFAVPIPFVVPMRSRLEHTVVVAGSGHGKTQLLQNIIFDDLNQSDPPSLIVIDSTGAIIRRLQRLAVFHPDSGLYKDRLIIIDPEHERAPALNMFDHTNARAKNYDRNTREGLEKDVIDLMTYVFSAVDRELTGRMSVVFSYVVRLLLSMPGADITTLKDLLEDRAKYATSKYRPFIEKLDPTAQSFFQNQFYKENFYNTRLSLAERIYSVIDVNAFLRMFSGVNKLDIFEAMQSGKFILVNTSTNLLKTSSGIFGRFILAKALAAAYERAVIPEHLRKPCFIIVDEASGYTDSNIETLLTKVRQFKVGVVLAYQNLDHRELTDNVLAALNSSTAVKYVGGALSQKNRRYLAQEMETTPDFIQAQKRDPSEPPQWSQFACYVRPYTDTAVSLKIPFYSIENATMMDDAAHDRLLAANARLFGSDIFAPSEPKPTPASATPPKAPSPEPTAPITTSVPRVERPTSKPPKPDIDGSDDY